MSAPTTADTYVDMERAQQFWEVYQRQHDVSARKGQAAGIDPVTGRVWFGESLIDIANQINAAGQFRPFYGVRVGYDYYLRKGSLRVPVA
ncbi:MAG: hypothetical protein COZ06_18630 [Armatimonadetes bacterium CG_4_10_14_3_um_filter_66_18]|nr:hypothetical protein [Armatimonadota bacterium]OIP09960.1 MAG: hypothetical protein AUJ96_04350 [Armatimonadetes bacterium CG2_30_66_41]PIU95353.1 MAG: hypothetical protein COS65_02680 [Armatimonadetes bacterium CG06_land_8_20_14_3_00_66_21]PIX43303.1 MAG: hypothetical protein COZ57_19515 [Armatimonadetes bacterium CG_4_8_14_3_um_filter_66_20]PIY46172.1 MAG: hypothetical protein COZ06_18630 [Armatimonadetes bacterium CG_4_10_14_3_um_filter_66_18]PIZ31122.1 MAG: hypothetical protein COY42_33